MHNRFKIFISIVVIAMFLGTGLASDRGTADIASSNAAEALLPAFGEVVNTWSLSGKTCAPSSASSGSTVALKIDVTSFSESSGAGPTVMYFVVNGKKIHSTDVDGTGVYTYNWSPAYANTTVSFHAEYLSGSEFFDRPSMHYAEKRPMVFFRNSYSTFGNSDIYIKWLQDCHRYMGYEGNNKIYLSTPGNGDSYSVYGYTNLGSSVASVNNTGDSNLHFQKDSSAIEAVYCVAAHGSGVQISLSLISMGASNYFVIPGDEGNSMLYTTCYQHLGLTLAGAPSSAGTNIFTSFNSGINVTGKSYIGTTRNAAIESIAINLLSLVPYAGYAATMYSIYSSMYSLSGVNGYKIGNEGSGTVFQNFAITGGNIGEYSGGKNVFGSVENISICLGGNDLNNNFKMNAFSNNYYECGEPTGTVKSANASETINAVTASAIYGHVDYTGTHNVDRVNNRHVYIKDTENGEYYQVPIVNGHYLFYAEPGTEYSIYTHSLNKLNKLTTLDGSELKDGSSKRYVINSDDL